MTSFQPETLTWTALLTQWIQFARGALALPADAVGDRWRASVPSIITLQAVAFALADIERLALEDRPLARDRAAVLIRTEADQLDRLWRGEPLPDSLIDIVRDARWALTMSRPSAA